MNQTKMHPQTFAMLPLMTQAKYSKSNRDERAKTIVENSKKLVDKIPLIIANALELQMVDLQSPVRTRELAEARAVIFYILRLKTLLTWKQMAAMFNRDHSTAIYGYQTTADLISVNKTYASKIERLMKLIN